MDTGDLHSDNTERITLESLLRVKRSERPSDEFWGRFDRELEEKRLRALIAQRSRAGCLRRFAGFIWNPAFAMTTAAACVTLLVIANPFAIPAASSSSASGFQGMERGQVAAVGEVQQATQSFSDMQRPARTAFALDTMTLVGSNSGMTPVSATERISTGYDSRVHFASGSIGTLATGSVAIY